MSCTHMYAHNAHKIFEIAQDSSNHYQAIAIIRNKIVYSENKILSFSTIFNFKNIIGRLNLILKQVYTSEQEMFT